MRWITRERPKIDRIACPWLILRFVDADAEFLYVPFNEVLVKAHELSAIPFDIPGAEYTHYGDECTFDYIIRKHKINDEPLTILAPIVRGADTDRHELATQASGLWAIFAGLSHTIPDDHELLQLGLKIYDALYAWAKHLKGVKHTDNPFESLLLNVYKKYLTDPAPGKKVPAWARELKALIQDQIDTNLTLSLKQVSETLKVHPSYLSREFSKYFDDLSFGEYIRKLRIEKSIQLLKDSQYTLAEIAYLTGFSDQSHFTRIFKAATGRSPAAFRKSLA